MNVVILAEEAAVKATKEYGPWVDALTRTMFTDLLVDLRAGLRLYYLSPEMITDVIWPKVRIHQELLDYVMVCASDMRMELLGHGADTPVAYSTLLANALSNIAEPKGLYTDESFVEKLPNTTTLVNVFKTEWWLVYLLTVARCAKQFSVETWGDRPSDRT